MKMQIQFQMQVRMQMQMAYACASTKRMLSISGDRPGNQNKREVSYIYIHMWGRLLLVASLSPENREMLEEVKCTKIPLVGLRALVGRDLVGWAVAGRALMGPTGPSWGVP